MIWNDTQLEALFSIQRTLPLTYQQHTAVAWAIARRFLLIDTLKPHVDGIDMEKSNDDPKKLS